VNTPVFRRLAAIDERIVAPVTEERVIRLLLLVNDLSHSPHGCGSSPACICVCTTKLFIWADDLSHSSHTYGFSPVVSFGALSDYWCQWTTCHTSHRGTISLLFPSICVLLDWFFWANDLLHTSHGYGIVTCVRPSESRLIVVGCYYYRSSWTFIVCHFFLIIYIS